MEEYGVLDTYLTETFEMLDMFRGVQMNEKVLDAGQKEFFEPEKYYRYVRMTRDNIRKHLQ